MTNSVFKHVKIHSIKTVVPQNFIDIDDELEYFDHNPKKLARAKKMIGYGRRYIADDLTTVTDLAVDAAEKLFAETGYDRNSIELLIFVNQKPDHKEPCDACIAHGRLQLKTTCSSLDINLGCSGYVHALWTAHAMIASGAVKNCLVLAGDLCARATDQTNRKAAPVFGDAASATLLEYTDEDRTAHFVTGTDGAGWDRIVYPFGGMRLPFDKETIDLAVDDGQGNVWTSAQGIMKGEDVFKFTMDVVPEHLKATLDYANLVPEDVDFFAIHQANKQIVENIIDKANLPVDKTPVETFSKYANNSTNSVVTVMCDQMKDRPVKTVVLCTFGIGLSWGSVVLNLSDLYNGGISTYVPPADRLTRQAQIDYWIKFFKGVEK
jgi:3-oxoacyl-[acyl-carrier-protein] synthase-3